MNRQIRILALAGLGLCSMPALSLADEYSGLYIGIDAGPSSYSDDRMYDFYALDDTDAAWGVHAGYRINKWVGVELGYNNLGRYQVTDVMGWGWGPYQGHDRFSDITASAVGHFPFAQGFAAYARLGLGVLNASWYGPWGEDRGASGVFGAGVEWTVPEVKALTLRAGFEAHSFVVTQKSIHRFGTWAFAHSDDYYQSVGLMNVGLQFNF